MRHLRPAALIAGGALAVHELRYGLAGGGSAEPVAGHGYLPLVSLAAALLLVLAFAHLLSRVALARSGGPREPDGLGPRAAWVFAAASLTAVFCIQELFEGLLATGRTDGLEAVFSEGGWTAVPLAVVVGGVIALVLGAARVAVNAAARAGERRRRRRAPLALARHAELPSGASRRPAVLAVHLAGRAPPALS